MPSDILNEQDKKGITQLNISNDRSWHDFNTSIWQGGARQFARFTGCGGILTCEPGRSRCEH